MHVRDYFLQSARLGFRCWRDTDLQLALGLWGDPAVTRYIAARDYQPREVRDRLQREMASSIGRSSFLPPGSTSVAAA
jgi:hypothetical protein